MEKKKRQYRSLISGLLVAAMIISLAVTLLYGCGSDDEESTPTPTSKPTPTATAKPTVTPKPTPTPTLTATSTPTPIPPFEATPTVTPSPALTPTLNQEEIEAAFASILPNLILVFGEKNGQWQGYKGPNVHSLITLDKGAVYWIYTTKESTPPGWSTPLYEGWNNVVWLSPTTSDIGIALSNYEDTVLFVISYNIRTDQRALYQSPVVVPLLVLRNIPTYNTFVQRPESPFPDWYTFLAPIGSLSLIQRSLGPFASS